MLQWSDCPVSRERAAVNVNNVEGHQIHLVSLQVTFGALIVICLVTFDIFALSFSTSSRLGLSSLTDHQSKTTKHLTARLHFSPSFQITIVNE